MLESELFPEVGNPEGGIQHSWMQFDLDGCFMVRWVVFWMLYGVKWFTFLLNLPALKTGFVALQELIPCLLSGHDRRY